MATGYIHGSKTDTIRRLRSTFSRARFDNPEINPVMASPPSMTAGTTADGTLTKTYAGGLAQAYFTVTGGKLNYQTSSGAGAVITQNRGADGGNAAQISAPLAFPFVLGDHCIGPYYYKFMTDAPKVQVRFDAVAASRNMRIIVDGQFIDRTGYDMDTNNYLTADFTTRQPRLIELECQYPMVFFSIKVDYASRIWKPVIADPIRAAIVGDSHTEGESGMTGTAWDGAAAVMARLLGIWDMNVRSIGTTGYNTYNGGANIRKNIVDQMDDWIYDGTYQMIPVAGGYNDFSGNVSAAVAKALLSWQKARAAQPHAFLPIIGIWGAATGPNAQIIALETALQAAHTSWGDNFSSFIPVSTASEPWEFGTGRIGATNSSGNSDIYVGSDAIHSPVAGQKQRGHRLANAIREAVFALAA